MGDRLLLTGLPRSGTTLACRLLGPGLAEVAWSTVSEAWGKGYASEAALASMKFTFARSTVETLSCFLRPDNTASRRVAEKIGFRYHDTRFLYGRPLRYYQITRKDLAD